MENFEFWFWDMKGWDYNRIPHWHVTIQAPTRAACEALAAQMSRDALDGIGTRIEVTDWRRLACRWANGRKSNSTKNDWKSDIGMGFIGDD